MKTNSFINLHFDLQQSYHFQQLWIFVRFAAQVDIFYSFMSADIITSEADETFAT